MKGVYPAMADELVRLGSPWDTEALSLYDIAGKLDRLLYESEGNRSFREVLLKHSDRLRSLHGDIETHIAEWKLARVDNMLYQLEDIFDDIERELNSL
jgi:hypothetical protein